MALKRIVAQEFLILNAGPHRDLRWGRGHVLTAVIDCQFDSSGGLGHYLFIHLYIKSNE